MPDGDGDQRSLVIFALVVVAVIAYQFYKKSNHTCNSKYLTPSQQADCWDDHRR